VVQVHVHAARLKRCGECRACLEKWFLERKDSFTSEWITPGTAFVPDDVRRVLKVLTGLPPGVSFFEQTSKTQTAYRGAGELVSTRIRKPQEISAAIKKFLRRQARSKSDGSLKLHYRAPIGALIGSLIHLNPERQSVDSSRDADKHAKLWHDLASLPTGSRICINGLARLCERTCRGCDHM
jgi:hypothetical protein